MTALLCHLLGLHSWRISGSGIDSREQCRRCGVWHWI